MDYALDSHPLRGQEGCIHQVRFGFKQQMFPAITMFNVVHTGGPGGISCSPRKSLGHFKEPHWPPPGLRSQRVLFWLSLLHENGHFSGEHPLPLLSKARNDV